MLQRVFIQTFKVVFATLFFQIAGIIPVVYAQSIQEESHPAARFPLTTFNYDTDLFSVSGQVNVFIEGKNRFRVNFDLGNSGKSEITELQVWFLIYCRDRSDPVLFEKSFSASILPDSSGSFFLDETLEDNGELVDGVVVPFKITFADSTFWSLNKNYLANSDMNVNNATKEIVAAKSNGTTKRDQALKVFLDRFRWYSDFIKQEIPYVNYVRDTRQAQVYILMTSQRTGGGEEFTLTFIGQENHTGINDTLSFFSDQINTEDERREGILRATQLGLIKYVAKTPFAEDIVIRFEPDEDGQVLEVGEDKWDYWVFRINASAEAQGEESRRSYELRGGVQANRITEDWKIRLNYNLEYNESRDEAEDEVFRTFTRENNFRGLFVKSINNHWSVGANTMIESDTRVNTKYSLGIAPAIEYNIFPYSMSTRKQFRFLYSLWAKTIKYREETIFDKTSENLYFTTLSLSAEMFERWGTFNSSLEGTLFLHDVNFNKLDLRSSFNIRIYEGLSFRLSGRVSLIHDQLFLAKEDISLEEILLRRRQLKTNFDYRTSIGFTYTFGSPYNNIVNPRFGDGGRRRF
jgi:hypothetical protein